MSFDLGSAFSNAFGGNGSGYDLGSTQASGNTGAVSKHYGSADIYMGNVSGPSGMTDRFGSPISGGSNMTAFAILGGCVLVAAVLMRGK